MGIDAQFPMAYAKSQIAAGSQIPATGKIFISMSGDYKHAMIEPARRLRELGFTILATAGTARVFKEAGIETEVLKKIQEGRPNLLDYMVNDDVHYIFNTPTTKGKQTDEGKIRAAAVAHGIPCVTTLPGCFAVVKAIEALNHDPIPKVKSIQEWLKEIK